MSQPVIQVQNWMPMTLSRSHGSREVFDLYELTVPADTEVPRVVTRLDMFLRLCSPPMPGRPSGGSG